MERSQNKRGRSRYQKKGKDAPKPRSKEAKFNNSGRGKKQSRNDRSRTTALEESDEIENIENEDQVFKNYVKRKESAEDEIRHDWNSFAASLTLLHAYRKMKQSELLENSSSESESEDNNEHLAEASFIKYNIRKTCRSKKSIKLKLAKAKQNPPNSFRNLSIIPTHQDLCDSKASFIRTNIVSGRYENVEHYLDVQFRLFREDYIIPLRNSIREYHDTYTGWNEKLKSANIYKEVKILNPMLHDIFGIIHILQFEPLPKTYVWNSKRLQEGSLVCLSSDKFKENFIFATVAEREDKTVIEGKIKVVFEKCNEFIYETLPSETYEMLETFGSYFESYRHTMSVLKNINEDNFPLKEYIVNCRKSVKPPSYLDEHSLYDLSPLLEINATDEKIIKNKIDEVDHLIQQLDKNYLTTKETDGWSSDDNECQKTHIDKRDGWSSDDDECQKTHIDKRDGWSSDDNECQIDKRDGWSSDENEYQKTYSNKLNKKYTNERKECSLLPKNLDISKKKKPTSNMDILKEIPILNLSKWPSKKILKLDDSQYTILKAALTKEFTIIQGPPGTGKTYMGLKIVKALLHNSNVWCPKDSANHFPILIVCYTNHALDQFLEKILEFTKKIVRVGRQGQSEKLEEYNLATLRLNSSLSTLPTSFSAKYSRHNDRKQYMKDLINTYLFVIEAVTRLIFPHNILKRFMSKQQYESLISEHKDVKDIRSLMERWLKVPYSEEIKDTYIQDISKIEKDDMEVSEICAWIKDIGINVERKSNSAWNEERSNDHERYVHENMKDTIIMTEDEATNCVSLWNLSIQNRWQLYRFWIAKFTDFLVDDLQKWQQTYIDIVKSLQEMRKDKDINIIQQADVVGMTCTGAAKFNHLIESVTPQIVIVEEAAEVLESHLITSLPKSTKHLILIGDHQQLRPLPSVHEIAQQCKFDISLFERMVTNNIDFYTLTTQHRMRPCIAELLVPHIYKELNSHISTYRYDDIKGIERNMYFISHNSVEVHSKSDTTHSNVYEAKMIVELSRYLLLQNYQPHQITILAMYAGQVKTLEDEMKKKSEMEELDKHIYFKLPDSESIEYNLKEIKITTVDNYQGEENDIILISFVRSNYEGKIGFLKTSNRVCVALSRARMGLYCIGNFEFLASESDLWKEIKNKLENQKAIGSCLNLRCQNHPSMEAIIESPNDFKKKVPDGGCLQKCDLELKCGHKCKRFCHYFDTEHKKYKCKEKCKKLCENEMHPCDKKCYEECGKCDVIRLEQLPKCGHIYPVPCHEKDLEKFKCPDDCEKILSCGHKCLKKCNELCKPCMVKIPKTFPDCGHTLILPCCKKIEEMKCTEPCPHFLSPCGHPCPLSCGQRPCPSACTYISAINLPCGHIKEVQCSEEADFRCFAPCCAKLPCGHKCTGTCSTCQKNKHKKCNYSCAKFVNGEQTCKLFCGHNGECNMQYVYRKRNCSNWSTNKRPTAVPDRHTVNKWKTDYTFD